MQVTLFSNGSLSHGQSADVANFAEFAELLPQLFTTADIDAETWRGLTSADLKAMKTAKGAGNAISMSVFKDDHRKKENFLCTSIIGLDFDRETSRGTVGELTRALTALKVNWVVCTSWSHTPESPRLRAFVELSRPVSDPHEYFVAYDALVAGLKASGLQAPTDDQCRDVARLFYIHLPCPTALEKMVESMYLTEVRAKGFDVDAALAAAPKTDTKAASSYTPAFTFSTKATGQDVFKLAMTIRESKKKQNAVADSEAWKRVCHAYKKNLELGGTLPPSDKDLAKGVLHPHSMERDTAADRSTNTQLFVLAMQLWSRDETLDIPAVRDFFAPTIKWTLAYARMHPGWDDPKLDEATVQEQLAHARTKAEAFREEADAAQAAKDEADPELKRMRRLARGDGKDTIYTAQERMSIAANCGINPEELEEKAVLEGAGSWYVASLEGYKLACPKADPVATLRLQTFLSPLRSWGTTADAGLLSRILEKHGLHKADLVTYTYTLSDSRGRLCKNNGELHLELRVAKAKQIPAVYSEDVERLLAALSDNYKALRYQLALAWDLDVFWPAMFLHGEGGTGKSTLVEALAAPWEATVDFISYVEDSRFASAELRRTPVVDFAEGAGSRGYSFNKLKRLITESVHSTESKNAMPIPLRGFLRVCVNVNDVSSVFGSISMVGENDDAIARRFVLHKVRDPEACRSLIAKLGEAGHNKRVSAIAQHISWLRENIAEESREWLKDYRGDKERTREFMTDGDSRFLQCYDVIVDYLLHPGKRGQEKLWVRPVKDEKNRNWPTEVILTRADLKMLREAVAKDTTFERLHLKDRELSGLLKQLSVDGNQVLDDPRKGGKSTMCYRLDMPRFWTHCDKSGHDIAKVKAELENLSSARRQYPRADVRHPTDQPCANNNN